MKILAAALSGPGHAHPMLAVAHRLASRGHRVTFMSGDAHAAEAAAANCSFVQMPIVFGSTAERLRPYEDSEALARACLPAIEQIAPDVVIADLLTFGPALAADVLGIPWASLLVHGLHTWSADLLPFGMGRAPARGIGRIGDAIVRAAHRRNVERARADVNEVRARLGLAPITDRLDPQLSGALQLVATLPSLELPRRDLPARARVIGPCLWRTDGDAPPEPPGDGPLVLIAPSTAHDGAMMMRAAIDGAVKAGARVILTPGRSVPPADLPEQVVVTDFASHDAIIPRCAAVVCNGGHGIVARALSHGVPVVVVPGHGDQRENGFRVTRTGAGLTASPRSVGRAVEQVVADPSFRHAAAAIGREAAAMDGPGTAATLIEELGSAQRKPGATVTGG